VVPGHALLVTRRHAETWFDATDEERTELALATNAVRCVNLERFGADGFTLGVNVDEAAGQTVLPLHMHTIHRRWGDVSTQGAVSGMSSASRSLRRSTSAFRTSGPVARLEVVGWLGGLVTGE
jgi:diadenosine tetraphosphate (Ap4A) HIT family hydrolase